MDRELWDIQAERIECDELWTYVAKKDKRLTAEDKRNDEIGSQFIFIGMDPATKLGSSRSASGTSRRLTPSCTTCGVVTVLTL